MKNLEDGVGVSKQYGFVSFARHDDAIGNQSVQQYNSNAVQLIFSTSDFIELCFGSV